MIIFFFLLRIQTLDQRIIIKHLLLYETFFFPGQKQLWFAIKQNGESWNIPKHDDAYNGSLCDSDGCNGKALQSFRVHFQLNVTVLSGFVFFCSKQLVFQWVYCVYSKFTLCARLAQCNSSHHRQFTAFRLVCAGSTIDDGYVGTWQIFIVD